MIFIQRYFVVINMYHLHVVWYIGFHFPCPFNKRLILFALTYLYL